MKICLISCTKKKKNITCPAYEMYLPSTRFKLSYCYAKSYFNADKIFILSAKYGLLDEFEVIETYDKTLNKMKRCEQLEWAEMVIKELKEIANLETDEFCILAGKNYYKDIIPYLSNYTLPLDKMPLGVGNSYLKSKVKPNF